jgi:hypothetical protein
VSGFSYHLTKGDYNQKNWGLGFEQTVSKDWSFVAGGFRNSNRIDSTYIGAAYMPLHYGNFKAGVFVGQVTGYAIDAIYGAMPVVSYERKTWGINGTFMPATDNSTGAIGVQFKWKFR